MAHEPSSMQEVTLRAVNILDAKYKNADTPSVVSTDSTHLSLQDQSKLLDVLIKFEDLFDGTLHCKQIVSNTQVFVS